MGIRRLTATVMTRSGKWKSSVVSVTTILVASRMCTKMPHKFLRNATDLEYLKLCVSVKIIVKINW
jgi:hypothetical protein